MEDEEIQKLLRAMEKIVELLHRQEWATWEYPQWEYPQTRIITKEAKNKNRDSADAEGRE